MRQAHMLGGSEQLCKQVEHGVITWFLGLVACLLGASNPPSGPFAVVKS